MGWFALEMGLGVFVLKFAFFLIFPVFSFRFKNPGLGGIFVKIFVGGSFLSVLFTFAFLDIFTIPKMGRFVPSTSNRCICCGSGGFGERDCVNVLICSSTGCGVECFTPASRTTGLPRGRVSVLISIGGSSTF